MGRPKGAFSRLATIIAANWRKVLLGLFAFIVFAPAENWWAETGAPALLSQLGRPSVITAVVTFLVRWLFWLIAAVGFVVLGYAFKHHPAIAVGRADKAGKLSQADQEALDAGRFGLSARQRQAITLPRLTASEIDRRVMALDHMREAIVPPVKSACNDLRLSLNELRRILLNQSNGVEQMNARLSDFRHAVEALESAVEQVRQKHEPYGEYPSIVFEWSGKNTALDGFHRFSSGVNSISLPANQGHVDLLECWVERFRADVEPLHQWALGVEKALREAREDLMVRVA